MNGQAVAKTLIFKPENGAPINRACAEAVDVPGQAANRDLRAALAERMMIPARRGELDEQRLWCLSVVAGLGQAPDRSSGQAALFLAGTKG